MYKNKKKKKKHNIKNLRNIYLYAKGSYEPQ